MALAFNSCSRSDDEPDGNGKTGSSQITITEYQWKFGERSSFGELYERYTYNKNNNLTEFESNYCYRSDIGRFPQSTTYKYDAQNHLIEKNDYSLTLLNYKYKYTFNGIDSIATMQKYSKEGDLIENWIYTYDSQRRLIQAKEIYDFIIPYVDDYTYNGNNVTVVRHRSDTGELFGTELYEYDNHYNLLKKTWTNGDTGKKDIEDDNEYTYNSKGQLTRMVSHAYVFTTELTYKDYTYNSDGTIQRIHLSYSFKTDQSDLDYSYTKL